MKIFNYEHRYDRVQLEIFGIKVSYSKKLKTLIHNPVSIVIDTTLLCNNNCYFCWRKNKPEYLKKISKKYKKSMTMPFSTYKKIIDDIAKYDCARILSLCGPMGEPMMNKNIVKFYSYAYKTGHFNELTANTNGLALDKHNIKELLNSLTELSISVDSINPDTYEKIHGNGETLPTVINNIKKCIEIKKKYNCKAKIVCRFTENDLNKGEFPEFKEFFKNLGVDSINYTHVHAFAGIMEDMISKETAKDCCHIDKTINFNFLGDMTTCCINWQLSPTFGNIENNTIEQMWNNEAMQKWKKERLQTIPCSQCSGLGEHIQKSNLDSEVSYEN